MRRTLKRTLSYRLFLRVTPVIAVTMLAVGVLAFRSATLQINHVYDAQLISSAHNLWAVIEDQLDADDDGDFRKTRHIDLTQDRQAALNKSASVYADSRMFRVFRDGELLVASDKALPDTIPMQPVGFSTVSSDDGAEWRVYSLGIQEHDMRIEIGEKMHLRSALVEHILIDLFGPLLLLVPLVALLLWVGITSGLSTIRALVDQISRRSPDDLTTINLQLPSDLLPLQQSINQLLTKLEHSFTAEQRFADNAAHQLRTPLATIKLQLQMLQVTTKPAEQRQLAADLIDSTERASRLVGQLLTAARINHQPLSIQQVHLLPMLAQILAEFGPLVKEKKLDMVLEGDASLQLRADETMLRLMISNLIDNAVKYTPVGGQIAVRLNTADGQVHLCIIDTGPGIASEARALVFERFYRVAGAKAEGTGLGLAIVGEIVARLHGHIALSDNPDGNGLQVDVILPEAA